MNSKGWALLIVGVLFLLAGTTFALQGAGYIGGSGMSGVSFWIYAGAGVAVVGLVLLAAGFLWGHEKSMAPAATAPQ